jgi:hypothetical protein
LTFGAWPDLELLTAAITDGRFVYAKVLLAAFIVALSVIANFLFSTRSSSLREVSVANDLGVTITAVATTNALLFSGVANLGSDALDFLNNTVGAQEELGQVFRALGLDASTFPGNANTIFTDQTL